MRGMGALMVVQNLSEGGHILCIDLILMESFRVEEALIHICSRQCL